MVNPLAGGYANADVGTVQLPDSSVYKGEIRGGLFNGHGKLTWRDGSYYEGEFEDGLMHGRGVLTFGAQQGGGALEGLWFNGEYIDNVESCGEEVQQPI